jgi:hypothetical protein
LFLFFDFLIYPTECLVLSDGDNPLAHLLLAL